MNELATPSQLLDLIASEAMPSGNLSIRGVARLCEVDDRSILKGADFKPEKLAQSMSQHGFHPADLLKNGFCPAAVWLTIEYFAYESKAKAPRAKQIARTFGAIGIKAALAQLAQLNKTPTPKPTPREQLEAAYQGPPEPEAICSAIDAIFGEMLSLHQRTVAKAGAVGQAHPQLKPLLAPVVAMLPPVKIDEQSFTVTEIGRRIGLSAMAVNLRLTALGYQAPYKTARMQTKYQPTDKGQGYAVLTIVNKADGTPTEQLRWKEPIVAILQEHSLAA